jgi:hypothetical protein
MPNRNNRDKLMYFSKNQLLFFQNPVLRFSFRVKCSGFDQLDTFLTFLKLTVKSNPFDRHETH